MSQANAEPAQRSTPKGDDPELAKMAAWINNEYIEIEKADIAARTQRRDIVDRAIGLGKTLTLAKGRVGHGNWLGWLATNCRDVQERTAQRYMDLAKNETALREKMTSDTMSDLTLTEAKQLIEAIDAKSATPENASSTKKKTVKKNASDKYDDLEDKLVDKLKTLALNEAEAAVKETTKKLNDVLRDKRTALESEQKKAA